MLGRWALIKEIYGDGSGERLVNVAISRAMQKLIVVGDPKVFTLGDELNEVSKHLRSLFVDFRMRRELCVEARTVKMELGIAGA